MFFDVGCKVFAKLRGYPPWPALIEGAVDLTPGKCKYNVRFYGTGDRAVIKTGDIYPYREFKPKFGKKKKPKKFVEAIKQIEKDLASEKAVTVPPDEGRFPIPSSTQHTTPEISIKEEIASDSDATVDSTDSIVNGQSSFSQGGDEKQKASQKQSDNDILDNIIRKVRAKNIIHPNFLINPVRSSRAGRKVQIPYSVQIPSFKSDELTDRWKLNLDEYVSVLQEYVDSGTFTCDKAEQLIEAWALKETNIFKQKEDLICHLSAVCKLTDINLKIRTALRRKKPNLDLCIKSLNDLLQQDITPLMLKKLPILVNTIVRTKIYVGKIKSTFTKEEEEEFRRKTKIIRTQAHLILNKFEQIFTCPVGKSFLEYYEEENLKFKQETLDWLINEVMEYI